MSLGGCCVIQVIPRVCSVVAMVFQEVVMMLVGGCYGIHSGLHLFL